MGAWTFDMTRAYEAGFADGFFALGRHDAPTPIDDPTAEPFGACYAQGFDHGAAKRIRDGFDAK